MRLHALRPLLQRDVTHKSSNGHSCPHGPTVNILLTAVISLAPSEDDLKAEASVRYGRDSDCQTVYVFTVVVVVRIGELFANPAFKVGDVAR